MKKSIVLVGTLLLLGLGVARAEGDAAAGLEKSAMCAACHGVDGNSVAANFPKLAGQHNSYIIKQLSEFKAGTRKDTTGMMAAMVAALSEQDMADLAAYFSSQDNQGGSADSALVKAGEALYRGGDSKKGLAACAGCHGPSGAGNAASKFPMLSGQHADYTAKQLQDFRNGERNNDPSGMMRSIAAGMSDDEMKAVASYISGLH